MIEILQLLHAQSATLPTYCGSYYVRNLYADEGLPDLGQGIPDGPLIQKDWIWMAYNRHTDQPVAMLVTAPAHGIVMLLRIYAIKSASKSVFVGLLRKALETMKDRGYTRYVSFLDPNGDKEAGLLSIATKAGATIEGGKHVMITGPTAIKW